jgi:hypothetical protein
LYYILFPYTMIMILIEWDMHRHQKRMERYACKGNVYGVTTD